MKKTLLVLSCSAFLLSSCHKEDRTAETLSGSWHINSFKWANGKEAIASGDVHTIEFFPCEQAYTATCRGVYSLNYADELKTDLLDTFSFDIKNEELAVTRVFQSTSNTFVTKILRQRYNIEQLSSTQFQFKRFRAFADSTDGSISAQKNN